MPVERIILLCPGYTHLNWVCRTTVISTLVHVLLQVRSLCLIYHTVSCRIQPLTCRSIYVGCQVKKKSCQVKIELPDISGLVLHAHVLDMNIDTFYTLQTAAYSMQTNWIH